MAKCRDILGFITSCVGITGTSLVEARYAAQGVQPGAATTQRKDGDREGGRLKRERTRIYTYG